MRTDVSAATEFPKVTRQRTIQFAGEGLATKSTDGSSPTLPDETASSSFGSPEISTAARSTRPPLARSYANSRVTSASSTTRPTSRGSTPRISDTVVRSVYTPKRQTSIDTRVDWAKDKEGSLSPEHLRNEWSEYEERMALPGLEHNEEHKQRNDSEASDDGNSDNGNSDDGKSVDGNSGGGKQN